MLLQFMYISWRVGKTDTYVGGKNREPETGFFSSCELVMWEKSSRNSFTLR
jgi:hypothetical protein